MRWKCPQCGTTNHEQSCSACGTWLSFPTATYQVPREDSQLDSYGSSTMLTYGMLGLAACCSILALLAIWSHY